MIKSHFGDIRKLIIEQLKLSQHYIYVAVAWITDKQLFQILEDKLKDDVIVKIVLVNDEINLNNGFDYDKFVNAGGTIYWDNHHHKFCVIDGVTVITGSYNWTYAANNRISRENILIIKEEEKELINNFASEFKNLTKQVNKHTVKQKEIIKIVEKEKSVVIERLVEDLVIDNNIRKAGWFDTHQKRTEWWKSLNDLWKNTFHEANYVRNPSKPNKDELKHLFTTDILKFELSKTIDDYSGLKNLSKLQTTFGLNLSIHAKKIMKEILPDCKFLELDT